MSRWLLVFALFACSGKKHGHDDAAPSPQLKPPADAAVTRPIDMSAFSRRCNTDEDCVLVDRHPCGQCGCNDTPIAKGELGRYKGAVVCPRADSTSITFAGCVECEGLAAACIDNKCTTRLTNPPVGAACATDADCVVSCARQGQCCPPAGCEDVVPRPKAMEIDTYNHDHCDRAELANCPQVQPSSSVTPTCRGGACYGQYR